MERVAVVGAAALSQERVTQTVLLPPTKLAAVQDLQRLVQRQQAPDVSTEEAAAVAAMGPAANLPQANTQERQTRTGNMVGARRCQRCGCTICPCNVKQAVIMLCCLVPPLPRRPPSPCWLRPMAAWAT